MPAAEQQPDCVRTSISCPSISLTPFLPFSRVSETLKETLPNLESVILTGNNIQELGDLEALSHLPKLQTLCLLMNPVSTKPHYREYMAYKFPNLRLLDFRKIKQKDRKAAQDMFKTKKGKELAKEISKRAKTFVPGAGLENQKERVPGATPADMQAIREAIKNATSLQEVERLTRMLQAGQIPNGSNFNQMSINGNGNGHGAEEEEEMEEEERQEVVEHVEQQQQPQQVDIQEVEEQADEDSQQEQVVQEESESII